MVLAHLIVTILTILLKSVRHFCFLDVTEIPITFRLLRSVRPTVVLEVSRIW